MWGFSPKPGTPAWERRCLERAKGGDRRAVSELYEALAPRLFREVLLPKLGERSAAEDALAETFRTLIERLDKLEPREGLYPWLVRVATNKAIDVHRGRGRRARGLASFESLLAPLLENPTPEAAAEGRVEAARLKSEVERVLEKINPRYQEVIRLRFFEERPRLECAKTLEVSPNHFDVLVHRALKSFRRQWEDSFRREELEAAS